jgi:hypothetical protein
MKILFVGTKEQDSATVRRRLVMSPGRSQAPYSACGRLQSIVESKDVDNIL